MSGQSKAVAHCADPLDWPTIEKYVNKQYPDGLFANANKIFSQPAQATAFSLSNLAHLYQQKIVSVNCMSTYQGKHQVADRLGFAEPNFAREHINIFIQDHLSHEPFWNTLLHESVHAISFGLWMQASKAPESSAWRQNSDQMQSLANQMILGKRNGYYQSLSQVRANKQFQRAPEVFIFAYANTYACMEVQANSFLLTEPLADSTDELFKRINLNYLPRYLSRIYRPSELNALKQSCLQAGLVSPVQIYIAEKHRLRH